MEISSFESKEDLLKLKRIASDRIEWKRLTEKYVNMQKVTIKTRFDLSRNCYRERESGVIINEYLIRIRCMSEWRTLILQVSDLFVF